MLPEKLQRQRGRGRLSGIYLIPSCANPTMITIPLKRRQELAEVIRKNKLILVEDGISTWLLAAEGKVLPSLLDILNGQRVIISGSRSEEEKRFGIWRASCRREAYTRIIHGTLPLRRRKKGRISASLYARPGARKGWSAACVF